MLMIAAPSMTLVFKQFQVFQRESHQSKKDYFSLVTLFTHFQIVMVVLLDFHGQKTVRGPLSSLISDEST